MTEDHPIRTIGGLQRRTGEGDLSRLRRANRTGDPTPTTEVGPTPPALADPPERAVPARPTPTTTTPVAAEAPVPRAAPAAGERPEVPKERVTVYLGSRLRSEARAAFRATGHLEGDRSWSDFVERAIATEVLRRQSLHNDGEPYRPDEAPLSPGRPMQE